MTGVNHTLKDIRPKAEEKARRKAEGLQQEAPPGNDGFMSERTRAKEALREEVNTYTGANVRKIERTAHIILRLANEGGFEGATDV